MRVRHEILLRGSVVDSGMLGKARLVVIDERSESIKKLGYGGRKLLVCLG